MKRKEVTTENINLALEQVKQFAEDRGFQIIGDLTPMKEKPKFKSWNQEKVLGRYLFRTEKKQSMSQINRFLHFLYKKVLGQDSKPRVEYSDRELAIQSARKSWIEARDRAEKLLEAYKLEKGDFYTSQLSKAA